MKFRMCEERYNEILSHFRVEEAVTKNSAIYLSTLTMSEREEFFKIRKLKDIVLNQKLLSILDDKVFEGSRIIKGYYSDLYFNISCNDKGEWSLDDCNDDLEQEEIALIIEIFERGYEYLEKPKEKKKYIISTRQWYMGKDKTFRRVEDILFSVSKIVYQEYTGVHGKKIGEPVTVTKKDFEEWIQMEISPNSNYINEYIETQGYKYIGKNSRGYKVAAKEDKTSDGKDIIKVMEFKKDFAFMDKPLEIDRKTVDLLIKMIK